MSDRTRPPGSEHFLQTIGIVEYFITNPRLVSRSLLGQDSARFEDPDSRLRCRELTADKRFGDNGALQASYRWSRLKGSFEGFFRNDNGQSDPAISSLFDFPTNVPTYTAIGVPEFGYRGDIRYLGAGRGPLPNDRPHQFKMDGNYSLNCGPQPWCGLERSVRDAADGRLRRTRTTQNAGEIPEGPRGSGIQTVDGFKTRSPFESRRRRSHRLRLEARRHRRVGSLADVLNLLNRVAGDGLRQFHGIPFGAHEP